MSSNNSSAIVSIIIPVYNGENTIKRCLNSVLRQTYDNLQIIVIDDGSTDGTHNICELYSKKDERILFLTCENFGVSNARNICLDNATGDYVCFLDSDDYIDCDTIAGMVSAASGFDMVVCGFKRENYKDGLLIKKTDRIPAGVSLSTKADWNRDFYKLYMNSFFTYPWGRLLKRDIIEENHLRFDTSIWYGEDCIFNSAYLKCCDTLTTVQKPYFHYVCDESGSLTSIFDIKKFNTRVRLYKNSISMAKSKNISNGIYCFDKMYMKSLFNMLDMMIDHHIQKADIISEIKRQYKIDVVKKIIRGHFNRDKEYCFYLLALKMRSPRLLLLMAKLRKFLKEHH